MYGEKWPHPDSPTCQALSKSVTRLLAMLAKLKKMSSSAEKEGLMSKFLLRNIFFPGLDIIKEESFPLVLSGHQESRRLNVMIRLRK